MRVLFLTNYYPPCRYDWGYMQLCEEVADRLADRGHELRVLTSTYRHGSEPLRPYDVERSLAIDPDWNKKAGAARQFLFGRRKRERESVDKLKRISLKFRPDVIFAWHCIGLSREMLLWAENRGAPPVAYYLANYLPELPDEYWRYWAAGKEGLAGLVKRLLSPVAMALLAREGKPVSLRFEHVATVSHYVRHRLQQQELISDRARVIHNGVDTKRFLARESVDFTSLKGEIRCLIAGRIDAEKGVHSVLEAFSHLSSGELERALRLTILGDGPSEYLARLRRRRSETDLEQTVVFRKPVTRKEMPAILAGHHVLILGSEYAEPLARIVQEAMGMGLLVVGTHTGGSGELLVHEATGLVFEPGDAASLASQLSRIARNPVLATRLARAGRQAIVDHFNLERMADEIEGFLASLITEEGGGASTTCG